MNVINFSSLIPSGDIVTVKLQAWENIKISYDLKSVTLLFMCLITTHAQHHFRQLRFRVSVCVYICITDVVGTKMCLHSHIVAVL